MIGGHSPKRGTGQKVAEKKKLHAGRSNSTLLAPATHHRRGHL